MNVTQFTDDLDAEIKQLKSRLAKLRKVQALRAQVLELEVSQSPATPQAIPLAGIIELVRSHFNIPLAALLGPGRPDTISVPRQIIFWLAYQTGTHYAAIGRAFGRDHTTVMYGVKVITDRMGVDPIFKHNVQKLHSSLILKQAAA